MSFYTGSGFRCRRDRACGFRVLPASGEDLDIDEAARARGRHERDRHNKADEITLASANARHTMAEIVDANAAARVDLDDREKIDRRGRRHIHGRVFRCRCCVCGERFEATGPRATYCPKTACQSRRRKVVAA